MSASNDGEATLDLELQSLDEMHKTLVTVDDPRAAPIEVAGQLETGRHAADREMLNQPLPSE